MSSLPEKGPWPTVVALATAPFHAIRFEPRLLPTSDQLGRDLYSGWGRHAVPVMGKRI